MLLLLVVWYGEASHADIAREAYRLLGLLCGRLNLLALWPCAAAAIVSVALDDGALPANGAEAHDGGGWRVG